MPQPQRQEETGEDEEGDTPSHRNGLRTFEPAGKHHQESLAEDISDAIERGTDAYIQALVVSVEAKDVKTVGSDILCGTGEGQDPEEGEGALEPEGRGQGESDACETGTDEHLHQQNPPSLGLNRRDERTPQRFDDPGKIEPRGVEGEVGVGQTETLVHRGGDDHNGNIRQRFCQIEGWHPSIRLIFHNR